MSNAVWLERGAASQRAGRHVEALKHFQAALELDETTAAAWYGRAQSLESLGRFRDAIEAFKRAGDLDRSHLLAQSLFAIGNCYVRLANRRTAIGYFDRALELAPHLTRAWHNRGTAQFDLGRYREAAASYSRALEQEPEDVATQIWRTYCSERLGDVHAPAPERAPAEEVAEAWMQIAAREHANREPERALAAFDRALAAKPGLGLAWAGRGACLAALGQTAEALQSFDRALSLDDEARPVAGAHRAALLARLGSRGTAADAYESTLTATPASLEDHKARALALQALNRHEEALRSLAVIKKLDPQNTEAWFAEGISLEALERFAEAAESFGRYLQHDPRRTRAWFRRARCLSVSGNLGEAVDCYQRAIALGPATAEVWLSLAISLSQLNRYGEAVNCLDRALNLQPANDVALYCRGVCCFHLSNHQAALADFDAVLEQGTPSVHSAAAAHFRTQALAALGRINAALSSEWTEQAYIALADGKAAESAALLRNAQTLDPSNAPAALRLAAYCVECAPAEEAVAQLRIALKLRPQNPDLWSTLGVVLSVSGQREEAGAAYASALEADPMYPPALRNLAILLAEAEHFDAALALYDRSLAIESDGNAWYGRGVCLARLQRGAEAVDAFRRAVEMAPDDADAWKDLGTCLVEIKKFREALDAWTRALRLNPAFDLQEQLRQLGKWTDSRLHSSSMAAYAYFNQAQYRDAAVWFDVALEIDPRQAGILNDRGLCAEHLEGPLRAIEYFDQALILEPDEPQTWYNKGVSLNRLRRSSEAVAAFEKVIGLHDASHLPPDQNLLHGLHNMGLALAALNRLEGALDCFDEVLSLARENPEQWKEEAKRAAHARRSLLASAQAGG
jgi:tetratricopeptide (TPR) repeat protein